jgi:hypothetical protein
VLLPSEHLHFPLPTSPPYHQTNSDKQQQENGNHSSIDTAQLQDGTAAEPPPRVEARFGPCDVIGELSFLTGSRSLVSVTSEELCRVLVVTKAVSGRAWEDGSVAQHDMLPLLASMWLAGALLASMCSAGALLASMLLASTQVEGQWPCITAP